MAFKKVKGTVDFYPEEMNIRNKIFDSLRNTAKSFNFKEVETPAIESMDLLTCKSGDDVKKQIFVFDKRGKEDMGLRFELTASIARMFIEKQKMLPKPAKWFALSRMWRYERPQKGREREFYQLSAELFGSDKPQADAEVVSFVIKCLTDLGLTEEDFTVKLNSRKLLQGLLSEFIDEEKIESIFSEIDKISKLQRGEVEANLRDLGLDDDQIESIYDIILTENIEELEPKNDLAKEGLNDLAIILSEVDSRFVEVDLSVVRGLAYYTGMVFEVFDKKGELRAIAGGGRYNTMLESFGGESCPATGFAIGYSTLSLLLVDRGILPEPDMSFDYFVAPISDDVVNDAMQIALQLRTKFSVDIDLQGRKLGKQLSYADSIGAKSVIIIGEDEVKSGQIKIKNLKTGEERICTVEDLLKE